jgi:hypothetical protein
MELKDILEVVERSVFSEYDHVIAGIHSMELKEARSSRGKDTPLDNLQELEELLDNL